MAYNTKNFSVMAYANGFTLWSYQTPDTMATVKTKDYFKETSSFVRKGDMILTLADNGGQLSSAILFVDTVNPTSVTVASVGTSA